MANAIATWLEIKEKMRRRMSAAEWDLAIRPARLWRAVGDALIVALPANGRAIYKFLGYRPTLQHYALQAGFGVCVTVDDGTIQFLEPEPPASRSQCPKCRAKIVLGAIFCQNCGKKLTTKSYHSSTSEKQPAIASGDASGCHDNAGPYRRRAGSRAPSGRDGAYIAEATQ